MIHCMPQKSVSGFTLLETMVAVALLTVSIVAPMSLTTQSIASAYYARDQITASYLAQEAVESIRHVRDGNILLNSLGTTVDLLNGIIDKTGAQFTIDTRNDAMALCSVPCLPLETDGTFYGYGLGTRTQFTRAVTACFVQSSGACNGSQTDEVKISVTVSWKTGSFQQRTVRISENLYRWVNDGSASG